MYKMGSETIRLERKAAENELVHARQPINQKQQNHLPHFSFFSVCVSYLTFLCWSKLLSFYLYLWLTSREISGDNKCCTDNREKRFPFNIFFSEVATVSKQKQKDLLRGNATPSMYQLVLSEITMYLTA